MTLDIHDEIEDDNFHVFEVEIKNGIMKINYGFRIRGSSNDDMGSPSFLRGSVGKGSNMQFLSMVYSIQINLKSTSHITIYSSNQVQSIIHEMLESLRLHCPFLGSITITGFKSYFNGRYQFKSELLNSTLLPGDGIGTLAAPSSVKKNLEIVQFFNTKESHTIALVEGMEVSAQLINSLNNSLSNIKSINLAKCTFGYDLHRNINLDFSGFTYVDRFDLDVSKLYFTSRTHAFLIIEYNGDNDTSTTTFYYKCKKMTLLPTTHKYIYYYNRFESTNSVTYTLKLDKICTFSIYNSAANDLSLTHSYIVFN